MEKKYIQTTYLSLEKERCIDTRASLEYFFKVLQDQSMVEF